jgi:hypothetical protein
MADFAASMRDAPPPLIPTDPEEADDLSSLMPAEPVDAIGTPLGTPMTTAITPPTPPPSAPTDEPYLDIARQLDAQDGGNGGYLDIARQLDAGQAPQSDAGTPTPAASGPGIGSQVLDQTKRKAYEFFQGLGGSFHGLIETGATLSGAVPVMLDKLHGALSRKTETGFEDAWFRHTVDPLVRQDTDFQLGPHATFADKAVHAVGGTLGMISQAVLLGPEAKEGEMSTWMGRAAHGIKAMTAPAVSNAVQTGRQVLAQTGSQKRALAAATTSYLTTALMGAVPMAIPGKLATRVASGAAIGAGLNEAQRIAQNATLPTSMRQPFSASDAGVGAIMGGLFGVLPHGAAPAPSAADIVDRATQASTTAEGTARAQAAADPNITADPRYKAVYANATQSGMAPEAADAYARQTLASERGAAAGLAATAQAMQEPMRQARAAATAQSTAIAGFKDVVKQAREAGVDPNTIHALSQGVIRREITHADAIGHLQQAIAALRAPEALTESVANPPAGEARLAGEPAGTIPGPSTELNAPHSGTGSARVESTPAAEPNSAADLGQSARLPELAEPTPTTSSAPQESATFQQQLEQARAETNTEPTQAQKDAGNYAKGTVEFGGMTIALENPARSTRSGVGSAGTPWQSVMQHDYGYVKGTRGSDREQVDAFLTGRPDTGKVFVVNQVDPATGRFDEHKAVLGAATPEEARATYLANYPQGWKGLGSIAEMPTAAFREKAEAGEFRNAAPAGPAPTSVPNPTPKHIRGAPLGTEMQARLTDPAVRTELERMASTAGWAERGGRLLMDHEGHVLGRTRWIPREDWFLNLGARLGKGERDYPQVIEDALAGRPLTSKERRVVEQMTGIAESHAAHGLPDEERFAAEHADRLEALRERAGSAPEDLAAYDSELERAHHDEETELDTTITAREREPDDESAHRDFARGAREDATQSAPQGARGAQPPPSSAEGETLELTAQRAPAETPARIPPRPTTDLFGDDTGAAQALADETRRRDSARNSGQESLETGDAGDMFSQARQQTDLTDRQPPPLSQDEIEERGEPILSKEDADRRLGAGDRIFAMHEQSDEAHEIRSVGDLTGYSADQLVAVPREEALRAPTRAGTATPRRLTPKQRAAQRLAGRREHFTPGNIVSSYGGAHDRVLSYHENPDGSWHARVQGVKRNAEGEWEDVGEPRTHATEPGKNGIIERRQQPPEKPLQPLGRGPNPAQEAESAPNHPDAYFSRRGNRQDADEDGRGFAAQVLHELGSVDDAFKNPTSSAKTLAGTLNDVAPHLRLAGEDTRPDEREESGADRRYVALSQDGEPIYIDERGKEIWIDVSRLKRGQGGDQVYQAIADYARNTGRRFVGDPMGLSADAISRRTYHMLSNMLRHGDSKGFEPAPAQLEGAPNRGIAPLDWPADNEGRLRALSKSFYETTRNRVPEIEHYRYDFNSRRFVGPEVSGPDDGRGAGRGAGEGAGRGLETLAESARDRATPVGSRALRAAVFLQSLVRSEGRERPGILAQVLRQPAKLVRPDDLPLFSRKGANAESEPAAPFYSAVTRAAEALPFNRASGHQWFATLSKRPGVKPEELDWLGLKDWLADRPQVTKDDLVDYLHAHELQVEETLKGPAPDSEESPAEQERARLAEELRDQGHGVTFKDDGSLDSIDVPAEEGGDAAEDGAQAVDVHEPGAIATLPAEIREHARRLMEVADQVARERFARSEENGGDREQEPQHAQWTLPGGRNYRELLIRLPGPKQFEHQHFEEPNVLAHVRFNERTDAEGHRTLFIEEVQSDWHQKGRKSGYRTATRVAEAERHKDESQAQLTASTTEFLEAHDRAASGEVSQEELKRLAKDAYLALTRADEAEGNLNAARSSPADAPFKTSWPELVMKRVVRWAAEHGFDQVAWTRGKHQVERYNLAKQIDRVDYNPQTRILRGFRDSDSDNADLLESAAPEELPRYIGKELSDRLLSQPLALPPEMARYRGSDRDEQRVHLLNGAALHTGGEGMHGFYDTILPSVTNKLIKRYGARVGERQIEQPGDNDQPEHTSVHGFEVTPAMREAALGGQPLFARTQEPQEPSAPEKTPEPGSDAVAAPAAAESAVSAEASPPAGQSATVRGWLEHAAQAVRGAADVHVVDNVQELRRAIGRSDIPQDVQGVYIAGGRHVYMVADQLGDRDEAERKFVHEVFGHLAMERYGDMGRAITHVIQIKRLGGKTVTGLWDEVARAQPGLDPRTHAKEVIALMAERGVKNHIIDRLITAARGLLRKMGVRLNYTDAELRQLIASAARALHEDAQRLSGADDVLAHQADRAYHAGDDDTLGRSLDGMSIARPLVDHDPQLAVLAKPDVTPEDTPAMDEAAAHLLAGPTPSAMSTSSALYARQAPEDPDITAIRRRVMANAKYEGLPLKDRLRLLLQRWSGLSAVAARQGIADSFASIAAYEKLLNGGKLLDASVSPYKQTVATQNLPSVMTAILHTGVPVYRDGAYVRGSDGRKGLLAIFAPLVNHPEGNLLPQWELYAAARRASRLIEEQNPDGTSRERLFTHEDIERSLKLAEQHPELEQAFNGWQDFNRQVLDMAQEAGLIDPDSRAVWEKNDYVPFHRAVADVSGAVNPAALRRAISEQRARILKLKGGAQPLEDVFESMLSNTAHLVDASFKNRAAQMIVTMFDGVATTPESLDRQPVDIDVPQVRRALKNAGVNLAEGLTPEQKESWLTFFRGVKPAGDNIVSVRFDGKPRYYRVLDPLLYQSMTQMAPDGVQRLLRQLGFTQVKRFVTRMATAMPSFLVRNFIRDTAEAWVQNHTGLKPFISAAQGLATAVRDDWRGKDKVVHDLMLAGAGGDAVYDNQPGNIKKILRRELADFDDSRAEKLLKTVVSPRRAWRAYTAIQQASENANRIAVYKAARAQGLSHAEAAYQAHDLLNFQQHGAWAAVRFATGTLPFLNARIQAFDRLLRSYAENRGAFLLKGSALVGLTMASMLLGQGNPQYQELEDWDRDTYWHFFAGNQHWRIPKPFELGTLFGTLPERAIRLMLGKDQWRDTGESIARMLGDTFALNPIPPVATPVLEDITNHDFFTGRPIVPESLQGKLPQLQEQPYTSPTLAAFSHALPDEAPDWMRSPLRLEHAIRGYTSAIGMLGFTAADRLTRALGAFPDAPAKPWYESWVPASPVTTSPPRNTKWVDELYRMQQKADAVAQAVTQYGKNGRFDQADALERSHPKQLMARGQLDDLVKQIRDLNGRARNVLKSRFPAAQKEQMLDNINEQRATIARQVAPYSAYF